jgi:hypothetical protein
VAAPVFGELRKCMQLALVGALVAHERLADKAGCNLPALMQEATLKTLELPAPKQVESRVSMLTQGHNWIISASGDVAIRPGEIVVRAREGISPEHVHRYAARAEYHAMEAAKVHGWQNWLKIETDEQKRSDLAAADALIRSRELRSLAGPQEPVLLHLRVQGWPRQAQKSGGMGCPAGS